MANNPIKFIDPQGLDNVLVYDTRDGVPQAAKGYDHALGVTSVNQAAEEAGALTKAGVNITSLDVLDHGAAWLEGYIEIGDPIKPGEDGWKKLANAVAQDGSITFYNCNTAVTSGGRKLLQGLANSGNRKVIGFLGSGHDGDKPGNHIIFLGYPIVGTQIPITFRPK